MILFGSRARGGWRPASDFDLAVRASRPIPPHLLAAARQSLEESRVPFTVDLLDYSALSAERQQAIDDEGVAWSD